MRLFFVLFAATGLALGAFSNPSHATPPAAPAAKPAVAAAAAKAAPGIVASKAVASAYAGNADQDFAANVVPSLEASIAMARTEQQYGKDPELKKIADSIVTMQQGNLALINAWRMKNPR